MILVAGATGSLGRKIVRGLADKGRHVRALVRRPAALENFEHEGVSAVLGDLRDPDSLQRACEGVSVVVTTASVSKTGGDSVENVDILGNQHLIEAAARAGVQRFVFVSTLGAAEDSPVPVFRAKGITERRLRESGLPHTILQPNAFMDVWFPALVERQAFSGEPVTLVGESRRRHAFIAEADVAAFAVASLLGGGRGDTTLPLGGPEAMTMLQVVHAYEQAAGRTFPVRSVAPGSPIPGLPEAVWSLAAALETFDSPVPMEETSRAYGVRQTSVEDFARSRVAAATVT